MFSGIITHKGKIQELAITEDNARLRVRSDLFEVSGPKIGDSISITGVCLTVVERGEASASFDIATETLRCTKIGGLTAGNQVNLERSMKVGDRIDGHFVQGHVDGIANVIGRKVEDNTLRFEFATPMPLYPYLAPKGSVAIDGVSLTLGEANPNYFSVYIIPHTAEITTLGTLKIGDVVNLEIDCLARYIVHAQRAAAVGSRQ